jgi:hypothetical protein
MTWTLVNSIVDTSNGATGVPFHTAMVYLFDTYLAARGWTIQAHPSGFAYRRRAAYTLTTNFFTGNSHTFRYWADWASTTAANYMYLYEDATYTSTPGDLATDTTNSAGIFYNSSSYAGASNNWRFWASDQVANATLVTRGKKVVWYHPGFTTGGFFVDAARVPGTDDNSSCMFPLTQDTWRWFNAPDNTGISGSTASVIQMLSSSGLTYMSGPRLFQGIPFGPSTASSNSTNTFVSFVVNTPDVLLYHTNSNSTDKTIPVVAGTNGVTVLSNSKYYLMTKADANQHCLAFDLGATEPDLS